MFTKNLSLEYEKFQLELTEYQHFSDARFYSIDKFTFKDTGERFDVLGMYNWVSKRFGPAFIIKLNFSGEKTDLKDEVASLFCREKIALLLDDDLVVQIYGVDSIEVNPFGWKLPDISELGEPDSDEFDLRDDFSREFVYLMETGLGDFLCGQEKTFYQFSTEYTFGWQLERFVFKNIDVASFVLKLIYTYKEDRLYKFCTFPEFLNELAIDAWNEYRSWGCVKYVPEEHGADKIIYTTIKAKTTRENEDEEDE